MYFQNVNNLDELKSAYRRLAMKLHPDHGGSTEAMQRLNAEYDALFARLKSAQNTRAANDTTGRTKATTEEAGEFRAIIEALLKLDGLEVELCGRWLWITGNTYAHKAALKELGCRWSNNKKAWTWHHAEDGDVFSHGKQDMSKIRGKYGSQVFGASGAEYSKVDRIGATA